MRYSSGVFDEKILNKGAITPAGALNFLCQVPCDGLELWVVSVKPTEKNLQAAMKVILIVPRLVGIETLPKWLLHADELAISS